MKYRRRLKACLAILLVNLMPMGVFSQATVEWKVSILKVNYSSTIKVRHPSSYYANDEHAPTDKTFALIQVELTTNNPEADLRLENIALVDEASAMYPALGISPLSEPPEFSLFEEQRRTGGFSVTDSYFFIANAEGTMLRGSSKPCKAFLLFAVSLTHNSLWLQIGDTAPVALPKKERLMY